MDALVLLPPRGEGYSETWLAEGRLACARDLVDRLQRIPIFQRVLVMAGSPEDRTRLGEPGLLQLDPPTDFHFGRTLLQVVQEYSVERLAYFGGASAPLASQTFLLELAERAAELPPATILPNNFHSTDWAFITSPGLIEPHVDRLPKDNSLGWVLHREAGFTLEAMEVGAASRFDVDTPSDLLIAHRHPDIGEHLAAFYQTVDPSLLHTPEQLRTLLLKPASTLTLIGRSSAFVWQQMESRTQSWVRLLVEERGMVASGRMEAGQVETILTRITRRGGLPALMEFLEASSDGVFWDNRVWLAATGGFPSPADRFAADLGRMPEIRDARLREMIESIWGATIPILAGGHGVVSGGLLALLESLGEDHQPSRN